MTVYPNANPAPRKNGNKKLPAFFTLCIADIYNRDGFLQEPHPLDPQANVRFPGAVIPQR